jgi:phosphoenolpyruvate carboxykinase (GTP)
VQGVDTPLGILPRYEDMSWGGLEKLTAAQFQELARVDGADWKAEVASHDELLGKLGSHLPAELDRRRVLLHERLAA